MATSILFNGVTYSVPAAGETSWSSLSDYLLALGTFAATTSTQKTSIRSPTGPAVTVSATTDCTIVCKPSPLAAVTVTLPVGVTGQIFIVVDGVNTAQTNNITVQGSSGQLIDGSATYVINLNNGAATFQFDTVGWRMISDSIGTSPLPDSKLATISTALKVSNSATTATSANSNSTIVARNGGGDISVQNLNAVQVITTGAASLGNASASQHLIQGAQSGSHQVNIVNTLNATSAHGLRLEVTNANTSTQVQNWIAGGSTVGLLRGDGKWQLGATGGTQVHELRGVSTSLIRPSDAVNQASYFGFTNAAGTSLAAIGLGANTGAGLIAGEINNGLLLKSAAGLVFSGVNNRVDGKMDSTGLWTLGPAGSTGTHAVNGFLAVTQNITGVSAFFSTLNTTGAAVLGDSASAIHTLQGSAASYQTQTLNYNATGSGITVYVAGATSSQIIQRWHSGAGTTKGFVDAAGKWSLGEVGGTQVHEIRGYTAKLIRSSDAANQYLTLEFGNAAGTTQAYVGLGANTGAGLVTGEINNGLAFKSAAGLVFSGVNNRVDGSMDASGAWRLPQNPIYQARGRGTAYAIGAGTIIQFGLTGGFAQAGGTGTNDQYTVPATGCYLVSISLFLTVAATAGSYIETKVNGTVVNRICQFPVGAVFLNGTIPINVVAGDVVTIVNNAASAGTVGNNSLDTFVSFVKVN